MAKVIDVIAALEKNNIHAVFVETRDQAKQLVISMIAPGETVGSGGSVTLDQCGIREAVRGSANEFFDWFKGDVSHEEKHLLRKKSLTCDVFLTSTNAITEDGKLVNIDGHGNRVAAMIFGPKKVIVVAGKNKITRNVEDALSRINNYTAPKTCVRLKKKTPCVKTLKCVDCNSPDRICSSMVVLERQSVKRITVVIVNEVLGY